MSKRQVLEIVFLFVLISLPVCAASSDVAYLYRSNGAVDENVLSVFEDIGLTVELVQEDDFPNDFSDYRAVFVGDERFQERLPVYEKPTIFMNHYLGLDYGLVDNDGISQLFSGQPLRVSVEGLPLEIYTSAKGSDGKTLSYYFLDELNKASKLQTFAGTYPVYSDKHGDVVSFAYEGDVLEHGAALEGDLCFFGATKSEYWTDEAYDLFRDCVLHVVEPLLSNGTAVCSANSDCDDGDFLTGDFCVNPGSNESYCVFSAGGPVFSSFVVDAGSRSAVLSFSAVSDNESLSIIEYAVKKDNAGWIVINDSNGTYLFGGLTPDTSYMFFVRAIDSAGNSGFANLSVRTDAEAVAVETSSGGGGGGYNGGSRGSGGCVTKWACGDWSECENGVQTRTCDYPQNYCEPIYVKPIERQVCVVELSQELTDDSTNGEIPEEDEEVERAPITGAVIGTTLRSPAFWLVAFLLVIVVLYVYVRSRTANEEIVSEKKVGNKGKGKK